MANPNSTTYINENVRQRPRRASALATHMVASGYQYDINTGLVVKVVKQPGDS